MTEEDFGDLVELDTTYSVTRRSTHFIGMVTGVVADGLVNHVEARMLMTWLTANPGIAAQYPINEIGILLDRAFLNGNLDPEQERSLCADLSRYATTDFSETGSVTAEPIPDAIDNDINLELHSAVVCFTGHFRHRTRKEHQEIAHQRCADCIDAVNKKVNLLVVGAASNDWAQENFGRKIEKAVNLQRKGHPISIISEERWLELTK